MNRSRGLRALFLWGPVALNIGFIFWLSSSSYPVPSLIPWLIRFPWLDKVFHSVEYFPLGAFLLRAILQSGLALAWPAAYRYTGYGVLLVGSLDEIYQRFTPLRSSDPFDVAADFLGAAAGQLFYWLICRIKQKT